MNKSDSSKKTSKSKLSAIGSIVVVLIAMIGILTGKFDLSDNNEPESTAVHTEKQVTDSRSTSSKEKSTEQQASSNDQTKTATDTTADNTATASTTDYRFRNQKLLNQHYEKHGIEMGFSSAEEYEAAAGAVVSNPDALHKKEAEDNDDVYYVEATNDFVIVSTDGYIRTYFRPDRGIDYYNRQ